MKKFFLVIISLMFMLTIISGCTVETAAEHDARTESEAESIRELQESVTETVSTENQTEESQSNTQGDNTQQTTTAAASATGETVENITVYLTVDCTNVIGKENLTTSAVIGDGKWLTSKAIVMPSGSSVYDVLLYAQLAGYGINFTENNSITNGYIVSINNLFQKECGKWSGWMYKVDGKTPGVGSKDYIVENGNNITWFFTTSS